MRLQSKSEYRSLRLDRGPMPSILYYLQHPVTQSVSWVTNGGPPRSVLPSRHSSRTNYASFIIHFLVRTRVCWCGVMRRTGRVYRPVCVPRGTSAPSLLCYLDPTSRLL